MSRKRGVEAQTPTFISPTVFTYTSIRVSPDYDDKDRSGCTTHLYPDDVVPLQAHLISAILAAANCGEFGTRESPSHED